MENEVANVDFAGVLKGALSLPEEDRRRLAELMVRVTRANETATGITLAPSEPSLPEGAREQSASEWLQTIRGEPAWVQLQLLEAALESTDDPSELEVLRNAHKQLLQDNPPIAVRRAVVRLASEHPLGICVGAAGLLLAVVAFASRLFHLAF